MSKYLKSIGLVVIFLLTFTSCKEQEQKVEEVEVLEEEAVDVSAEKEAVAAVMKSYKDAVQNLTTQGTKELFTKEATVFESGGSEGTFETYESHHLGPELKAFDSFTFSDYKIEVKIDMPYAFTTETYNFTIALKANQEKGMETRIIKKKAVATSDLKKIDGQWKITKTHSSSRDIREASH
ncbi:ketosteroid isomerase-like protein [Gillisia sp. Hel_I_86]|uniref:nuclear transport factor 2 family protein n=1 Tax=Gillisia sp. Hel_I_86 TaxID=1249981 RepID=UPI00119C1914|nr:nuclear transport factor 2 family protein [Gillisia sp. Hel_I_86]TVZ25214.1 ketosteroid isomerase-like protein [Gillisia sp. Hel_I_86]